MDLAPEEPEAVMLAPVVDVARQYEWDVLRGHTGDPTYLSVREITDGGLGDVANVALGVGAHASSKRQPPYLE
jgi:hypothetical protein